MVAVRLVPNNNTNTTTTHVYHFHVVFWNFHRWLVRYRLQWIEAEPQIPLHCISFEWGADQCGHWEEGRVVLRLWLFCGRVARKWLPVGRVWLWVPKEPGRGTAQQAHLYRLVSPLLDIFCYLLCLILQFQTWWSLCRAPETAKIKQKMVYASTKEGFKKKLVGVAVEVQGTDFSEISHEAVLEKARQF